MIGRIHISEIQTVNDVILRQIIFSKKDYNNNVIPISCNIAMKRNPIL